ncbi:MAG: NAD(P)-dependent oxidoreductase [Candidatus Gastranaerophilales bacterium]
MTNKILFFDYRECEESFFEKNKFQEFEIEFFKESLSLETIEKLSQETLDTTTVISVFITSEVNAEIIERFKNLQIISTRSTGIDHIDKLSAQERNIDIINIEGYGSQSVAQYTFGLILALTRNIISASRYLHDPNGNCESYIGHDISKLTIGVVGTGSIGASVCKIATAFNMKIIAFDMDLKQEIENTIDMQYVDFHTLVKNSDIITLHLPYTKDNHHIFSDNEFDEMKPNSYFINTSRGELVNLEAVSKAIKNKKLNGLALDVTTCEEISFKCDKKIRSENNIPLICKQEEAILAELLEEQNVIITPHIAYSTQEAIDYILEKTFFNISNNINSK